MRRPRRSDEYSVPPLVADLQRGRQATDAAIALLTAEVADDPTLALNTLGRVLCDLSADANGVLPLLFAMLTLAKTLAVAAGGGDRDAALEIVQQIAAEANGTHRPGGLFNNT